MQPVTRKSILAILLIATLTASWVDIPAIGLSASEPDLLPAAQILPPDNHAGSGKKTTPPSIQAAPATTPPTTRPDALPGERFRLHTANLFPVHSWQPPPPPAEVVEGPPAAPPLPFQYAGKLTEGENTIIFLSDGARTHLVRRGDALQQYRVSEITATDITFVYLPLKEKQILTFGSHP